MKAAVRVWSESVRREMFKFKVKVILVEPTIYKTGMTDYITMVNHAKQCWDKSDLEVRTAYEQINLDFVVAMFEVIFQHIIRLILIFSLVNLSVS